MSLAAKLDAIREGAKARIPEDSWAKMHKATQELRESGIINEVLAAGERIPSFSLESESGELVDTDVLLGKGPLVLTFYRGSW